MIKQPILGQTVKVTTRSGYTSKGHLCMLPSTETNQTVTALYEGGGFSTSSGDTYQGVAFGDLAVG